VNGKKQYFYIAGIVILVGIAGILFWQNMQLKSTQDVLLNRINQAGSTRQGIANDPYIAGPVKNTITKNARGMQECYNEFIGRKPAKTDGMIIVDWRISTSGKVIQPEIVSSELQDDALKSCMTSKIATWRFPEPEMEKYISHRFTFKKK
jgi:hypothetical protein